MLGDLSTDAVEDRTVARVKMMDCADRCMPRVSALALILGNRNYNAVHSCIKTNTWMAASIISKHTMAKKTNGQMRIGWQLRIGALHKRVRIKLRPNHAKPQLHLLPTERL